MRDNDPKNTSWQTKLFIEEKRKWWKTPAKSPDLNPTENLGMSTLEGRSSHKPTDEIEAIWNTMVVQKCKNCIGHLLLHVNLLN